MTPEDTRNYAQLPCLTSQPGKLSASEEPCSSASDCVLRKFSTRTRKNNSSIFNSISLASGDGAGDDSDLVYYRSEFVILGLGVLSTSGGMPGCVPIV